MKATFKIEKFYDGYEVYVKTEDGLNRSYYHQNLEEAKNFVKKFKKMLNK